MKTFKAIMVFVLIAMVTWFNAQLINWKHGKETAAGWHRTGLWIRIIGMSLLVLMFIDNLALLGLLFLIWANVSWTGWDIVINLKMGSKWYYLGNTSFIDKWFQGKLWFYWGLKGLLFLSIPGYLILRILCKF